jgi:sulfur relay (sulfurtransferase) DsrC/TusE family protein
VDIDLSLYKDYLGRPITETYLSLIKNKTGNNYGVWDNIKSGIQTSVPKVNYDIRQINESTSTVLDMGVVKSSDTVFLGDIMDYNEGDISERVLVDINHRFNSINRDLNNYYEGYFYSPHKKMIIKYYSNQIEYSDIDLPTINVPDYALTVNGRKMWRDILTKGYIDEIGRGVDYPFLNGFNYISNNFQLSVKRQDPELNYEHGNDPIIIGIPCNITENINTSQDVC